MHILQSQDSLLFRTSRFVYRSVRGAYRQARALRNRFFNLIDPPIIILIYHRVTVLSSDPEMIAVAPDNFRRQMEYLKQHFRILRLDDNWSELKEPAVVITFDDGYADNFVEALPILEEVGVPVTFFISTGQIGADQEFWWHRLEALLLREGEFPSNFKLNDPSYGRAWDSSTLEQRKVLYVSLCQLMRKVDADRQNDWLCQIRSWSGAVEKKEPIHRTMTKQELKQLAASPWTTIGAHSVSHSALSALSAAQQRNEILSSKQKLEEITGLKITTFSYPFGRRCEYNQTSVRLCREAGFCRVASNFPGQVHKWTDPFQLPRHLVRDWDQATFVAEMKGFWTR